MKIATKTGTQEVKAIEKFTHKGIDCFIHKDDNDFYVVSEKITGKAFLGEPKKKYAKDRAMLLIDKHIENITFCIAEHLKKSEPVNV